MNGNGRFVTLKNSSGHSYKVFIKSTNQFMNDLIRNVNIKKIGIPQQYKKYDNDEEEFRRNNPDIVLKQKNNVIDEWTADSGGYHSNSEVMEYMRENRQLYEPHAGWEQGIRDIDNQITGRTSENITAYRTIQTPVKNLNIGDLVDENTFIATSIDRNTSVTSFNYGDSRSSTIEVEVDKGTRCLYIGDKTEHRDGKTGLIKNEYELLFPEEYQIRIIDKVIEYDGDGDYLRTIFKGKMEQK